jgi:hypothetical protein
LHINCIYEGSFCLRTQFLKVGDKSIEIEICHERQTVARNFIQQKRGLRDNRFRQTETLSDLTYNNIKSGWIKHCHFGQRFAIEFTTNFFETRNKLAVP